MMNSRAQGEVMNDDLRTIDWVPDGDIKLRPRTFVTADALRLTLSPDLFARKFDAEEDSAIFDLIEARSEEHTSELQSLMRISYAVFCLKKKNRNRILGHSIHNIS